MVVMAMLFVTGMREVLQGGTGYRTGLIAGVSFWTGAGFQAGMILPEFFSEFAGGLLQNGMTSGGLAAILLTLLADLIGTRGSRFRGMARSGRASQAERVSSEPSPPAEAGGRTWKAACKPSARKPC